MAKNSVTTSNPENATDTQAPKRGRGRPPKHGVAMSAEARSRIARINRTCETKALVQCWMNALHQMPAMPGMPTPHGLADARQAARRISPFFSEEIGKQLARIYGTP